MAKGRMKYWLVFDEHGAFLGAYLLRLTALAKVPPGGKIRFGYKQQHLKAL
jgi:hypothetical protein